MNRIEALRTSRPTAAAQLGRKILAPLFAAALFAAGAANAQALPPPLTPSPVAQFDMTGFIQTATLDTTNARCPLVTSPLLFGGTVTLNGITMIVPCNMILEMPAPELSWAELFLPANQAPVGGAVGINGSTIPAGQSGLALADLNGTVPTAFPSFEIHAVGNIVPNAVTGAPDYIIGLILPIAQEQVNAGAGTITCIDYTTSAMYVGGVTAAPGATTCTAANGAKIVINDPVARFGAAHSPDPRFASDTDNPTIHSGTGYPMCIPRIAPPAVDPLCPLYNRPLNGVSIPDAAGGPPFVLTSYVLDISGLFFDPIPATDQFTSVGAPAKFFTMPTSAQAAANAGVWPDPTQQVPFMVGDFINYSGTLAVDPTTTPASQYISAVTIIDNVAIFTSPGDVPAYTSIDELLIGTAGTTPDGIRAEPTSRIFVTGHTTDVTALVDLNAVDQDPCTGVVTRRTLASLSPAAQPEIGRWRFHVLGGQFMPPTRAMNSVSETNYPVIPFYSGIATEPTFANGLLPEYTAPNFTFIFPENVVIGEPILSNNFQDFPVLAVGSGPLHGIAGNPVVGQLTPWPGDVAPAAASCAPPGSTTPSGTAPLVSAGTNFVTGPALPESLLAAVVFDANSLTPSAAVPAPTQTATWTVSPAGAIAGFPQTAILNPTISATTFTSTPSFTSPPAGTSVTFTLTVTDQFGTTVSNVSLSTVPTPDTFIVAESVYISSKTPGQGVFPCGGGCGVTKKVGDKGGRFRTAVTSSDPADPNMTVFTVGFGFMEIDPQLGLPSYTGDFTGSALPLSATVRDSHGGEITFSSAPGAANPIKVK